MGLRALGLGLVEQAARLGGRSYGDLVAPLRVVGLAGEVEAALPGVVDLSAGGGVAFVVGASARAALPVAAFSAGLVLVAVDALAGRFAVAARSGVATASSGSGMAPKPA